MDVLGKSLDLGFERALLLGCLRRTSVECNLVDNIFFREASRLHFGHRQRIARIERSQQITYDFGGLVDLLRIGTGCIHQHIHSLAVYTAVSTSGEENRAQQHDP